MKALVWLTRWTPGLNGAASAEDALAIEISERTADRWMLAVAHRVRHPPATTQKIAGGPGSNQKDLQDYEALHHTSWHIDKSRCVQFCRGRI